MCSRTSGFPKTSTDRRRSASPGLRAHRRRRRRLRHRVRCSPRSQVNRCSLFRRRCRPFRPRGPSQQPQVSCLACRRPLAERGAAQRLSPSGPLPNHPSPYHPSYSCHHYPHHQPHQPHRPHRPHPRHHHPLHRLPPSDRRRRRCRRPPFPLTSPHSRSHATTSRPARWTRPRGGCGSSSPRPRSPSSSPSSSAPTHNSSPPIWACAGTIPTSPLSGRTRSFPASRSARRKAKKRAQEMAGKRRRASRPLPASRCTTPTSPRLVLSTLPRAIYPRASHRATCPTQCPSSSTQARDLSTSPPSDSQPNSASSTRSPPSPHTRAAPTTATARRAPSTP
mmetsp:Transcript_3617/g.6928  ORF Transcript_3617/g.6928 Transcript_3617/m.6928 type:complete len:336 (-) Transcript_3617:201-1208(-)